MQEPNSGIHRVYRLDNQPFAQIPREAIRDPRVTQTAFRLLAYLMSHEDGYELTYGQIERETGMGRYAINEAIKNLDTLGWLKTKRPKLANGQYGPKAWYVLNPHLPTVGNSTVADSTVERPTDKEEKLLKNRTIKTLSRATRIPENFAMTEEMRAWAAEKRPDLDPDLSTEKFKNYWEAKSSGATKLDWVKTWRNWILGERVNVVKPTRVDRAEENRKTFEALYAKYAEEESKGNE